MWILNSLVIETGDQFNEQQAERLSGNLLHSGSGISDCEPPLTAVSQELRKVNIKAELCAFEVDKWTAVR
jgi:hypothetical protein